jgi:hypothetical protein
MTLRLVLGCLLLLVLLSNCAIAGAVSVSFTSSLLTAQEGLNTMLTFSATITNTTPSSVFLNSDSLNIAAPLTADDTKFFLNTPPLLLPGESVTAPIFDVTVASTVPAGIYAGNFTILGGATGGALDNVGSAVFAVQVVPEPGTSILMLAGSMLLLRRRTKQGTRG